MTIALQFCNVTVNDVDESISFYGDALGLQVVNDVASGEYRWVTLGTDASPASASCCPSRTPAARKPTATPCRNSLTKGVLPLLVFNTDDVDATFERVRASGAEVLQEPMDQGWGPRDCAFRDPSGNTVRIAQRA